MLAALATLIWKTGVELVVEGGLTKAWKCVKRGCKHVFRRKHRPLD